MQKKRSPDVELPSKYTVGVHVKFSICSDHHNSVLSSEPIKHRIQVQFSQYQCINVNFTQLCVFVRMNECGWVGVILSMCVCVCMWFLWMWMCECVGLSFFCSVIKCVSRGETIERKKRKKRKTNNDEMKIRFNTTTTNEKRKKNKWGRDKSKAN